MADFFTMKLFLRQWNLPKDRNCRKALCHRHFCKKKKHDSFSTNGIITIVLIWRMLIIMIRFQMVSFAFTEIRNHSNKKWSYHITKPWIALSLNQLCLCSVPICYPCGSPFCNRTMIHNEQGFSFWTQDQGRCLVIYTGWISLKILSQYSRLCRQSFLFQHQLGGWRKYPLKHKHKFAQASAVLWNGRGLPVYDNRPRAYTHSTLPVEQVVIP